jgi:hypothetical protein
LLPLNGRAQSPGRWITQEKFAPNPNPEEEYWNAVANGKLYLMGGNQGGKNDRVLEYDLATDKWTTKKPAPWSANHMALGEYRGHIFVFGGATQESQPNALKSWEYDPVFRFVERACANAEQANRGDRARERREVLRDRRE